MEESKARFHLPGHWRILARMEQERDLLLFYVDTENAGDRPIEVSIINARGETVLDTVVPHQEPWKLIYEKGDGCVKLFMNLQKRKFDWSEDFEFPTEKSSMNASQLNTALRRAGCNHPDARLIEFLRGNMDVSKIRPFLTQNH